MNTLATLFVSFLFVSLFVLNHLTRVNDRHSSETRKKRTNIYLWVLPRKRRQGHSWLELFKFLVEFCTFLEITPWAALGFSPGVKLISFHLPFLCKHFLWWRCTNSRWKSHKHAKCYLHICIYFKRPPIITYTRGHWISAVASPMSWHLNWAEKILTIH